MNEAEFDNEIEARNFSWEQIMRCQHVSAVCGRNDDGMLTWVVSWKAPELVLRY